MAFNCEDTLRRAVASALEQDYLNTEILIVDDCSTDHTHTIALELAAAQKNQSTQGTRNGGVAATRNLIINNTNADFIVFFDDDDVSAAKNF